MTVSVQTDIIRFRIEEDIKARAENICARLGMEMNDVLRTLVRRIALDKAIPFDMHTTFRVEEPSRSPFDLTDDLAHLKAEAVISLLWIFAAKRARQIALENRKPRPNRKQNTKWETEAEEAMEYSRTMDTRDDKLVAKVEQRFAALLVSSD
jgi:addiction module RelB/DinJ family antitoxin